MALAEAARICAAMQLDGYAVAMNPTWRLRALSRGVRKRVGRRRVERLLRTDPGAYRRRLRMTLRDWLLYHQRNVLFEQSSWMGVPALKNPLDAWVYQEIVHRVRPETIIEIGSASGGSTL